MSSPIADAAATALGHDAPADRVGDPSVAELERLIARELDPAYRRRLRTVVEWLAPRDGERILDAGAGRGFYLGLLRRLCRADLVGIELDPTTVAHAWTNLAGRGIPVLRANVESMPFADASFDGVILSEVLEHVPDETRALAELYRVLRPGGRTVITVPNAHYPWSWDPINRTLEDWFGWHIASGLLSGIWAHHLRLYRRQELAERVAAVGFEIVAERSFVRRSLPFLHNLLYGVGKPLLEAGALPRSLIQADRRSLTCESAPPAGIARLALALIDWFDRGNRLDEPDGVATVNLCLLARKPGR